MDVKTRRKVVLVGDKILVSPDRNQERTEHGLYLPPGVKDREKVQGGIIVQSGPGYAIANPNYIDQEPWSTSPREPVKYIPLQVEAGDYALFLRDQAVEIEFEGEKYFIISQSSILMLVRNTDFLESTL
jgi:co-chaperonin GroES (HSP10)